MKTLLIALGIAAAGTAVAADVPAHATAPAKKASAAAHLPAKPLVDINRASLAQLKTLPGIGDEEAQRIVAGRPYLSKTDLATGKVLPTGTYLSIRRLIVAKPLTTPVRKAKSASGVS